MPLKKDEISPRAYQCYRDCEILDPKHIASLLEQTAVYVDGTGRETAAGVMLRAAKLLMEYQDRLDHT